MGRLQRRNKEEKRPSIFWESNSSEIAGIETMLAMGYVQYWVAADSQQTSARARSSAHAHVKFRESS